MKIAEKPQRLSEHRNALGLLRLIFASLVIVSHTPEIVDGDPRRELVHMLAKGATSGTIAVNGFFVISGFLIAGSYLNSPSDRSYILKRVVRIYPAFIVASLFCLLLVAPLSGASFPLSRVHNIGAAVLRMSILARPQAYNAFPGQHFNDVGSALDGAMWTIQYEFACYLLVMLLGITGVLRRPVALACASLVLLSVAAFLPPGAGMWLSHIALLPGQPSALFSLTGLFLAGAAYRGIRHQISVKRVTALLSAAGLAVGCLSSDTIGFAYAICGTYLIFALADRLGNTWVGAINNRNDVSYGLYLYAWPVEQLLIRYVGTSSLLVLGVATWLIAMMLGTASWFLVERPALRLRERYMRRRAAIQ